MVRGLGLIFSAIVRGTPLLAAVMKFAAYILGTWHHCVWFAQPCTYKTWPKNTPNHLSALKQAGRNIGGQNRNAQHGGNEDQMMESDKRERERGFYSFRLALLIQSNPF